MTRALGHSVMSSHGISTSPDLTCLQLLPSPSPSIAPTSGSPCPPRHEHLILTVPAVEAVKERLS